MRTLVILVMVFFIGLVTAQQGISGIVTAYQGGKEYHGWVDDNGRLIIQDQFGKSIMSGWVNRMGRIDIYDEKNDELYQGRVRPLGECLLNSRKGGPTLRIKMER
ncbi:MAG: hypothetical protein ACOZF2_01255 [Thermodesulfobacteriota bacterium]